MREYSNENIEIKLLLDAVYLKYGYDFRQYAKASIRRRILRRMSLEGLGSISELQHKLIYDVNFFDRLLQDLSINTTEMFRDPHFYRALRNKVVPALKKRETIKIWNAGCSSGEEAYSMAILLQEEQLYNRSLIYATDFNQLVLQSAQEGIFPLDRIQVYTLNYHKAGGLESFSDYYMADTDYAIINNGLKENIVFADHNLVTDGVFGEMDLIMCRNVLIYFNRELQNRVLNLFTNSLNSGGFLCLGSAESIRFSPDADRFEDWQGNEKIYQRKPENE